MTSINYSQYTNRELFKIRDAYSILVTIGVDHNKELLIVNKLIKDRINKAEV